MKTSNNREALRYLSISENGRVKLWRVDDTRTGYFQSHTPFQQLIPIHSALDMKAILRSYVGPHASSVRRQLKDLLAEYCPPV